MSRMRPALLLLLGLAACAAAQAATQPAKCPDALAKLVANEGPCKSATAGGPVTCDKACKAAVDKLPAECRAVPQAIK